METWSNLTIITILEGARWMEVRVIFGIIGGIIAVLLIYLAYLEGFVVTQVKSAVLYNEKNRGKIVRFMACDGYTKRVLKFNKQGVVSLEFKANILSGNVSIEILNKAKEPIICMNRLNTLDTMIVDLNQRYYLKAIYENADGNFELIIK